MGAAFASVITAFTALITANLPGLDGTFKGAEEGDAGFFLNALIAFILLAAVVYFFIVVPYTKAKERFFPTEAPGEPADVALLTEIRDLLAQGQGRHAVATPPTIGTRRPARCRPGRRVWSRAGRRRRRGRAGARVRAPPRRPAGAAPRRSSAGELGDVGLEPAGVERRPPRRPAGRRGEVVGADAQ
jgi:large conductance mechanosensitive channel